MAQSPYCDPYYSTTNCTTYYMSINAMEISQGSTTLFTRAHNTGGMNGCNASTGYYTLNSTSSQFTLKAGATYKFGFTTGPTYAVNIGVWIDLNGDKDFADANEYLTVPTCVYTVGNVAAGSSSLTYFNVKIPTGVTPGVTRMRIRSLYYYSSCWGSSDNGCSTQPYGEAEDFTITLASDPNDGGVTSVVVPQCGPTLKATINNLGNNDINPVQIGWKVNTAFQTPMTHSTTITPGGSANITLTPDFTFVDGTNYTVKVFTYQPNNVTDVDKSNDTATIKFTYLGPAGTPTTFDAVKCGPGKAPLKCTTPFQTDSVVWYNAATAGQIIAKGKNTLSPSLVLGVNTFYAQSFKISQNTKLENSLMGNYTYYTTGQAAQGGYANLTPKTDMFLDSFRIRLYNNTPGSTYSIYMMTGSYLGSQTNSSAWTQIVNNAASSVRTISGFYIATLKVPELMLAKGTTYGFCILSTGSNPVWTFAYNNAGHTASDANLDMFTQHYFYGSAPFSGYWAQGYPINLEANYRRAICPSARVPITLTVKPSPNGATFAKGTPFQTTQLTTNGSLGTPDVVAKGDQLTYELVPPTTTSAVTYTNSTHGSSWLTMTPEVRTKKGTIIASGTNTWMYTQPSGSTAGKLVITPDGALADSFLIVSMQIKDLGPHFCDSTILKHIFVAPRPVTDFKFNTPICDGDAVLFSDKSTIASGTLTYKYDFNTGNPADTGTTADFVFKFPTYGSYDVKLTTKSLPYGYTDTKTITVVVTEIPKIDFKVLNACEKVPVSFKNNTTIGAGTVTYDWDFGDPSTTLDKSTAKDPTWTYTNPNAYKVTLRATANGCSISLSKNANQFATPKASWNTPPAPFTLCDKSDIQFTNTSTIKMGNMGYTWNFGDGGVSNFANPIHVFANSSPKSVKMKAVSEFGCVDSLVKTITMNEAPKADFSWGAACNLSNTDFMFTGSKPSGQLTTFSWNFAGEGTSTLENPSKLFNVVSRKLVTLTLISNNGCSDIKTKEVNVKLQSKAVFEIKDVCEDDDAVFVNKSIVTAGNLVYNWKFGDGKNSAAQSPRHRYTINGVSQTFNVTLVAVVPGGCSDSINVPVTVNAKPKSDFNFATSGRQVSFTAGQPGNTLYQWRFGDGGSSNSANPQYSYLTFPTGKYTACLAVINAAGCFSESCKDVNISGAIDKLTKLSGVKIYPNPSKGNFTVSVENPKADISIGIYNLLGEIVKTIETDPLKSLYSVDLNVSNGVYMVKVTNGGLVSTQKVTINK
ncbi:MAG: PKD domain-containing protein [Bacteroidia bacterium]